MKKRILWMVLAAVLLIVLPCLAEDTEPSGNLAVFPETVSVPDTLDDSLLQKLIQDGTAQTHEIGNYTLVVLPYPNGYVLNAYYETESGKIDKDGTIDIGTALPDSTHATSNYFVSGKYFGHSLFRFDEQDGKTVNMQDYYGPDGRTFCTRIIKSGDSVDFYIYHCNKNVSGFSYGSLFGGAELKIKGEQWFRYASDETGAPKLVSEMDPEYARFLDGEAVLAGALDVARFPEYPALETVAVQLGETGERTGTVRKNDSFLYADLGGGEAALLTYIGNGNSVEIEKLIPEKTVIAVMEYCFTDRKGLSDPDAVPVYSYGGIPYECTAKVSKLTLPETVAYLAPHALESVPIQQITLPQGLKEIGEMAFSGTKIAKLPALPEGCLLGQGAFMGILAGSVTLPEGMKEIPARCFAGALATSYKFPSSLETIGEESFAWGKIQALKLAEGVTSIGDRAFIGCGSLASAALPKSLTSIGEEAFRDCAKLKSIVLPDGISHIGDGTFSGCSALASATIPATVESIADNAFDGCSPKLVLTVTEGSYAESWAADKGISVKVLH